MQDDEAQVSIQRPFPTHALKVRILEKGIAQHSTALNCVREALGYKHILTYFRTELRRDDQ